MRRVEIPLVDIGEGLADAVISTWLVKPGDVLVAMQPYVEIDTDKVTTELPAPQSGRVLELCFAEGDTVPVGACLLVIDADTASDTDASPAPTVATVAHEVTVHVAPAQSGVSAAPAVRKLAKELSIDLAQVTGTGPNGVITTNDVKRHSEQASPASDATYGTFPLSKVRTVIAENMQTAWRDVPHITDLRDIEVARLKARKEELSSHPVRPTYTAFFVAAVAQALRTYPRLNASLNWPAREVTFHEHIHIGIATFVDDDRLVVPVVRNADTLDIFQITEEIRRLGELAKAKKLTHEDVVGATFNISSSGQMGGGWYGTPIVSPPQVGVMGFGPIMDKVVAENSQPVVRPVMPLMISVDHRLIDGRTMCVFGNEVERHLRECHW